METAVVRGDLGLCGKHTGEMTQIDGAGQQDTNDQNAEALQAALAQREVTLEAQPQGGSDVPSHQNSDPVIRRIGNSTPPSGSYRKTSCTVDSATGSEIGGRQLRAGRVDRQVGLREVNENYRKSILE